MTPRGRLFGLARAAAVAAMLCCAAATADDAVFAREAVKAEFLCRFTAFVTWPAPAIAQPPFRIGVLGDETVAGYLEQIVARRKLLGMETEVVRLSSSRRLPRLQMLYVGSGYGGNLRSLAASLRDQGVLLVTERDAGLDDGAMINFVDAGNRVRFEIAPAVAESRGLKIGAELLAVAARVREGDAR